MPSFNQTMVTKYQTLLQENVGASSVSVDGMTVSYVDALKQYNHWLKQLAIENGTRRRVVQVDMGTFP